MVERGRGLNGISNMVVGGGGVWMELGLVVEALRVGEGGLITFRVGKLFG